MPANQAHQLKQITAIERIQASAGRLSVYQRLSLVKDKGTLTYGDRTCHLMLPNFHTHHGQQPFGCYICLIRPARPQQVLKQFANEQKEYLQLSRCRLASQQYSLDGVRLWACGFFDVLVLQSSPRLAYAAVWCHAVFV